MQHALQWEEQEWSGENIKKNTQLLLNKLLA
jgi:hypothetical protein